jgi:hypothetical protein
MNAILNLGTAVTVVVLVSLSFYLEDVYKAESCKGETIIYATAITILTICAVSLFYFR